MSIKSIDEKYQYFGNILNFNEIEIFQRKKNKELTKDTISDFKPDKYLKNLNLVLKKKNKNLNAKEVKRFEDLDVPSFNFKDEIEDNQGNYYSIRLIHSVFDFDCFLTLSCKNVEYVVNSITNRRKICSIDCITDITENKKTFIFMLDNNLFNFSRVLSSISNLHGYNSMIREVCLLAFYYVFKLFS